ncbi:MAG TPA: hypothetical protein V6D17_03465 [Candidatus Obscuribacterales bacterium]
MNSKSPIDTNLSVKAQVRAAIEQCQERLKDLTERTCIEVWIRADEAVVDTVIAVLRNNGIEAEYIYAPTTELKSIMLSRS